MIAYLLIAWVVLPLPVALAAGWVLGRISKHYPAAVEAPAARPRHGASTGTRQLHHVRAVVTTRSMN